MLSATQIVKRAARLMFVNSRATGMAYLASKLGMREVRMTRISFNFHPRWFIARIDKGIVGHMHYKLVAFDMDGTLVVEPNSWEIIHYHFRVMEKAAENLKAWERGEIDYPEFMRRDISLWKPRPRISQIEEILSDFKLAPNASEVVRGLHEKGYQVAIVSGGVDILAQKVANRLGIEYVLANGLETDGRGYLTGEGIFRVDPRRKHEALKGLTDRLGIRMGECVGVGDSKYDIGLLKNVGMGVAIGKDEVLARVADVVIEDFEDFGMLLDYL